MVAPGDDAGGHIQKALAPERGVQDFAGVDAAAMQVAFAVHEQPEPFLAAGHVDLDLDPRTVLMEAGQRCRHDRFDPCRAGGDAETAGSPRPGRVQNLFRSLDLPQNAPCEAADGTAQRRQAHAVGQAFEQPAPELALKPGDDAGERRLGDRQPVGRRGDPARFDDCKEPDQIAAFLEHVTIQRATRTEQIRRIRNMYCLTVQRRSHAPVGGLKSRLVARCPIRRTFKTE